MSHLHLTDQLGKIMDALLARQTEKAAAHLSVVLSKDASTAPLSESLWVALHTARQQLISAAPESAEWLRAAQAVAAYCMETRAELAQSAKP